MLLLLQICLYSASTQRSQCQLCTANQFLHKGACITGCPSNTRAVSVTGSSTGNLCLDTNDELVAPDIPLERQYQAAVPTLSSNRVCRTITAACPAGTYQTAEPTATSDRRCPAYTNCTAQGGYIRTPGTLIRDHVCQPLSACTASQYVAVPATATSDQTCAALTPPCQTGCVAGVDVLLRQPCTCAVTGCAICVGSLNSSSASLQFSTDQCLQCADGTSLLRNTLPHRCVANCPAGTTRTNLGEQGFACLQAGEAAPSLPSLQYESQSPTATSDRTCGAMTMCTADEYETTPAAIVADRTCAALTTCTPGTRGLVMSLQHCSPPCLLGMQYESLVPSLTSDRRCATCASCGANRFETTPCTLSSNRVCAGCRPPCNGNTDYEVSCDKCDKL